MEWEERDVNSMSFVKHCVAGSCAGIMEHMGLYPVDTLKVSNTFSAFCFLTRWFNYRLTYKLQEVILVLRGRLKFYTKMKAYYVFGKEQMLLQVA
jgi:hypothetical protein